MRRALRNLRAALRLARRGVVEDELLEDVRLAVRPVGTHPLLMKASGAWIDVRGVIVLGGKGARTSSSYTPARMVRSAVMGHLSVAPLSEKQ